MNQFLYELKVLCDHNRDGSYASQAKRRYDLNMFAQQLMKECHYPRMHARSLKEKHVIALLTLWQSQGIATSTIKARMSRLRWWAKHVGKPNLIKPNNQAYCIGKRQTVSPTSKACDIDVTQAKAIPDEYVVASLWIAREFGLRKEEAIKFIPNYADQGDYIQLKASWCKGGKARKIPIQNQAQREALDYAKKIAGSGSLIPADKHFHQQKNRYEKQTNKAGFRNLHGLRHRYAQWRYEELTGWQSPHADGPKRAELTEEEKDIQARLIISKELGHERLQIASVYLG